MHFLRQFGAQRMFPRQRGSLLVFRAFAHGCRSEPNGERGRARIESMVHEELRSDGWKDAKAIGRTPSRRWPGRDAHGGSFRTPQASFYP